MISTVDVGYDGPQACIDCLKKQIPVCDHVGFLPDAFTDAIQQRVHVPGLDAEHDHLLLAVQISADRKRATLTIDTHRPWHRELTAHVSAFYGPHAHVRAFVDDQLVAENRLDAPAQVGETVYVNGEPHQVLAVEHPNRDENGSAGLERDWQHITLRPTPVDPVTVLPGGAP